jgi:PQQ-dependent catabolism-associated CXXCW motif protein
VIRTLDLKRLLDSGTAITVVDVLDSQSRFSIPGASWLPDGGKTFSGASERTRFETSLQAFTTNDKSHPLVFLCTGVECWLSYNAALAAIELGYKDVLWYRGGTNSWLGANLQTARPKPAP